MARARAYEVAVQGLWDRGLISGEMHLGTGEEAVAAGVVTHVEDGDGLALTHRCSPALVVRGVPLVAMLREMLGAPDGLCGGCGGHMHLMSRDHLAASSGIVGASMPVGAGFALAARTLRPHAVGVSFVGDGAMNQGMALETLNLAVGWSLPLLVVCIDNGWAITTAAGTVTGGDLAERAHAFGLAVDRVDGTDVLDVHETAGALLGRVRKGKGPAFLYATCPRMDGHFLGDPLLEQSRHPTGDDARHTLRGVVGAAVKQGGGGFFARAGGMVGMMGTMLKARHVPDRDRPGDPMFEARKAMRGRDAEGIEAEARREVVAAATPAAAGPQRWLTVEGWADLGDDVAAARNAAIADAQKRPRTSARPREGVRPSAAASGGGTTCSCMAPNPPRRPAARNARPPQRNAAATPRR